MIYNNAITLRLKVMNTGGTVKWQIVKVKTPYPKIVIHAIDDSYWE